MRRIFLFLILCCLGCAAFCNTAFCAATGVFMDISNGFADSNSAWYMERMGIPEAQQINQGQGAVVALIDSGVTITHPALQGCIDTELSYNTADDSYDLTDYLGHGTMMAGLVCGACDTGNQFCGVAPQSRVIVYKVSSGSGYTFTDYDLAEAIRLAADSPAVIINLSLVLDYSEVVEDAIKYALSLGKVVVAAAGNEGGVVAFPASIDGVVSVGAVDTTLTPLSGSGAGPYLVQSAPGYNLGTTSADGGFGTTTGTSGAAALVSGVLALVHSAFPDMPAGVAMALLAQSSQDQSWPGFDIQYGFGIVNAFNAVTGTNPLQNNPDRNPAVYLTGNLPAYLPGEYISMELSLSGIGGQRGDMYIQETDPRGDRFYFVFGENRIFDLPWPYNKNIGSPYLFPDYDNLTYTLFGSHGTPLLSNGAITPQAHTGLYEMVVGVDLESGLAYSRVVVWIGE